jgi:hypothetical protein
MRLLILAAVVLSQAASPSPDPMVVPIQGGNPAGLDAMPAVSPSPSPSGGGGGGVDHPQQPGAGPVQGEESSPVGRRSSPTPRPS